MSNTDDKEKSAEDYSYTTAAINQILVKANCPDKFRQYIFCLAGMANKDFKFQASDSKVAAYARGRIEDGGNKHADKGWARDKRRELIEWQDKGNLKICDCEVQKRDPKTHVRPPTKYTLHILKYAEQVVSEAQSNKSLWRNNPSIAIQQATHTLVTDLLGQQVNAPKKKYIDPPSEVKTKLKTARTNLEAAARMLEKYDFKLLRQDEKLIEEIETSIRTIRNRGFVDDIWETIIFSGIEKDED